MELQPDRTPRNPKSMLRDNGITTINKQRTEDRGVPILEKDPRPLEGWSVEEQRSLINAIRNTPRDLRKDPKYRQIVYSSLIRPIRPLEGRNPIECEECYAHVQTKRIAYLGPLQHKQDCTSPAAPMLACAVTPRAEVVAECRGHGDISS